jgi:3-hydroxyisobutyrate dehydrogenase-like beta-hydroxyacid dehydrogenase
VETNYAMNMSICILGLGLMGRPLAQRLLAAGYAVSGWNRSPVSSDLLPALLRCADLQQAARAEVCVLMLSDTTAVEAVLAQLEPHLQDGQIVLDMGTSDPVRSRRHAERLARRGVGWVDAPVSGGPEGAAAGTLAIMVGGSEHDVARVEPVLATLGSNVVHVGGPGAGHTAKIINQLIVGLTIEAVAEALVLAEQSGLDPALVQAALAGGFADSKILQIHGTRMINRAYVPGAKVTTQRKDLRLAQALAARVGLSLPHLESTSARYEVLVACGEGELDHSALHRLLDAASRDDQGSLGSI